jgi:hypothetical protein
LLLAPFETTGHSTRRLDPCYFCSHLLCRVSISPFAAVAIGALALFLFFWILLRRSHKGTVYVFFDAQDCVQFCTGKREYPLAASKTTFEPLLKHYIGVTQLLITVAAASIAFGSDKAPHSTLIVVAKLLLAWSIFYGVLFCACVLYRYDEYTQNIKSYTVWWYSTVEALGFSTLACFVFGYLSWGWGLSK